MDSIKKLPIPLPSLLLFSAGSACTWTSSYIKNTNDEKLKTHILMIVGQFFYLCSFLYARKIHNKTLENPEEEKVPEYKPDIENPPTIIQEGYQHNMQQTLPPEAFQPTIQYQMNNAEQYRHPIIPQEIINPTTTVHF